VRIKNGYKLIMELYSPYRNRIYEYNDKIRDTGYYLKPIHIVHKTVQGMRLKYIYFGRYWYRVVRKGKQGIKWIYVGRDKPDPHLPDPPLSPFEGLGVTVTDGDILVDEYTFKILEKMAKKMLNMDLSSATTT